MSSINPKKLFEKPFKSPEAHKFNYSFDKSKYLPSKFNNPAVSDSSKSSKKQEDPGKSEDDISVSSKDLGDSDVSISNKSEILNNLNEEGSEDLSTHKSDEELSDHGKQAEVPTNEKGKEREIKGNFSFEELKREEFLGSQKKAALFTDSKPRKLIEPEKKIEDLRSKYWTNRKKEDFPEASRGGPPPKRTEPKPPTSRIFIEIRQINNEIDELEKELSKTFKFYGNSADQG